MKKVITLGLTVVIISSLVLSGCSKKETVKITLPEEIVEGTTDFNEKEHLAKNEGIKSAKTNDNGSLTLTMEKQKHDELLGEVKVNMEETFEELIEGKDTPYIKDIEYTNDYREIKVMVDEDAKELTFDFIPYKIGTSAGMYQLYLGEEYKSTITIADAATGEEFYSVVYPDKFEE